MANVSHTVLGSNWFENFLLCRKNPRLFLDSRKLTKEALCLDIIKDLCSDYVENQCKVHLLLLLQEHGNLLIHNSDLLEQTVGSLRNLYDTNDNKLLKSQMLIAITTILLSCDSLNISRSSLLSEVKALLVDILISSSNDNVLVSAACRCLEEIEIFHPKILMQDFERLLSSCQSHMLPSFQDYVVLISICLKNILETKDINETESSTDNSLSDKDLLSSSLTTDVQVPPVVAYLLELLPLMTPAAIYNVFKNLIEVVKYTPELLPMIKPWIPKLITSSDVLHFHLAFELLKEFGHDFFSSQEKEALLRQLILACDHPSLTTSHRLLYLDWLSSCINNKNLFFPNFSMSNVMALLPKPFDGPFTQEKKLRILTICIIHNKKSSKTSQLFINSLNGLKQSALLLSGSKAATSLFRALFLYCSTNENSPLISDIHRMVPLMVMLSPHLMPHALDFLSLTKSNCGTNTYYEDSLEKLIEHTVNLPVKQLASYVYDYLLLMEVAVMEQLEVPRLKAVLGCLQKLVFQCNSFESDQWLFGNAVLSVCRSFFKFHNTQILFFDISELLFLVIKHISDIDVRLRAKMYYAAFTSLSRSKADNLFLSRSCGKTVNGSYASFSVGMESPFNFCYTFQKLPMPVIQLVRVEKMCGIRFSNPLVSSGDCCNSFSSDDSQNVLSMYRKFLISEHFEPSIKIPFILKHLEHCDQSFSELYAIVLNMETIPSSKKTSEIKVPVLKFNSSGINEGISVVAEFVPCGIFPVSLTFRAEFTCHNGSSYITELPSIKLQFEDLFSLIPVPSASLLSTAKPQLFDEMWNFLRSEARKGLEASKCCASGLRLQVNVGNLEHFVVKNWEPFVMAKPPEVCDFCIAIFLPPRNHLLMKITFLNDAPFVHILTDNWMILPFVNTYLRKLT